MTEVFSSCIERIIQDNLGQTAIKIERFSNGLSHHVFDVETQDYAQYVVRLTLPERRAELAQGLYWHKQLQELEIPLPKLYFAGNIDHFAFAIYERLPGIDLELLYPQLSAAAKQYIANTVAEIQRRIGQITDPQLYTVSPWSRMLYTILDRSEREINSHGLCDKRQVEVARARVADYEDYFANLQLVAFSYDHNVRNIIIHQERVSGIVDVDELWLGDPLLSIGRGKTLLLLMAQDTDYITAWCDYLKLGKLQRQVVDLYALIYCVRFMGTLGQRLNGNTSIQTNLTTAPLLEQLANNLADSSRHI